MISRTEIAKEMNEKNFYFFFSFTFKKETSLYTLRDASAN
jgi:hypothetical protein